MPMVIRDGKAWGLMIRSGLQKIQKQCQDVILPLLWLLLACSMNHAYVTATLGVLRLVLMLTDSRAGQACKV